MDFSHITNQSIDTTLPNDFNLFRNSNVINSLVHGQNILLSSNSWSSSSSCGLEENQQYEILCEQDGVDTFEIVPAPSDFFETGCQMMMVEASSESSPHINDFASVIYDLQPDQSIQLWQFLLECLEDRRFWQIIRWTSDISPSASPAPSSIRLSRRNTNSNGDHTSEFCILEPRELARYWIMRKYGHEFVVVSDSNYFQRFNRVLRYYLNKKRLLSKIVGKSNIYVFQINIQPYLNVIRTRRSNTATQQHDKMLLV